MPALTRKQRRSLGNPSLNAAPAPVPAPPAPAPRPPATFLDLSSEIVENIFLHLGWDKADTRTIYSGLLVSKLFYSAVRRAPLLDTIVIRRTKQIHRLLCSLTKDLVQAQYIRRLEFRIEGSELSDAGTMAGRLRLDNDFSPIAFLLYLAVKIRYLVDVPILHTQYDSVLQAILGFPPLSKISFRQYSASLDLLLRPLSLPDVHSICRKMPDDKSDLHFVGYDMTLTSEL